MSDHPKGKDFKTEWHCYNPVDNSLSISTMLFSTKSENDHYAKALQMMGENKFFKYYYNPHIREWYRYHNDKPETK